MKKNLIISGLLILTLSSCIEDDPIYQNNYRENFEALWEIVDTRYCYLNTKNINWDSIYSVYEQRLATDTVSEIAFFDAMASMLSELKDGHVNLYSAFDRSRYWNWFTDYPANFSSSLIYNERYLGQNYRAINGLRYQRIAGGEVGYLYYSSFGESFSDQNMRYVFQYFADCKGLIIDVRDNGGGSADLSGRFASYFFQRDTVNLYMKHKIGPRHDDFSDPVPMTTEAHPTIQWQLPVVVLSNRLSYSATNMFISRMKDAPKVTVMGDRSGGGGGLPMSSEIPNGWLVRFSSSPMFDTNMNHIEFGVDPDIAVALDSIDQSNGYDTIIEKAIELIKETE